MGEAAVPVCQHGSCRLAHQLLFAIFHQSQKNELKMMVLQITPEDLAVAAVAGIATAERFGAKGVFGQNVGNVAQRVVELVQRIWY